jgi:putative flippase GtrA
LRASRVQRTCVTYVIYILALEFTTYRVAYSISFAAGVVIAFVLHGQWVFRSGLSVRAALQFPLVYAVQYALGLFLLGIFVERMGIPIRLAPLLVVACSVPITFALTRVVFKSNGRSRLDQ